MGELNISVTDLGECSDCGHHNQMIFQTPDGTAWYIACGYRTCEHKTEEHEELLDACSAWGLKAAE